jgi:SAM-dependent methyltransferase
VTWDDAYRRAVPPPWDIGRPQPEFVHLAREAVLTGRLIDVGCGTGENALMAAGHGLEVVGVDIAPTAIERARAKVRERELRADFRVWDVLDLGSLAERIGRFDTAIDSGVFHTFSDEDRPRYVESVAAAVRPGGHLYLMCFSELEPDWGGPRRVTQAELREAFSVAAGWLVDEIRDARFATNLDDAAARAWLATVRRTPAPPSPSIPAATPPSTEEPVSSETPRGRAPHLRARRGTLPEG